MKAPGSELLAICHRLVDPAADPLQLHPGHNGTSVLRATTKYGNVIIKIHRSPERHRQEIHAYQHWTPALGDRAPELLAISEDPPGIIVTCLPGIQLSEAQLSAGQEADAHRQAGVLLRRLHEAGPPRLEPDITAWLAERGEHWLDRGRDMISAQQAAEVRAHLRELTELAPILAVPCHLDFMPRNLLIDQAGDLSVIDFEHAHYDLSARDLVRLASRVWPERPGLKSAFLSGYRELGDLDESVIQHCAYLDRLTARVPLGNRRSTDARESTVSTRLARPAACNFDPDIYS